MQQYDPMQQGMGMQAYGPVMGAPMGGSNMGFDASIGLERVFPCVRLRGEEGT